MRSSFFSIYAFLSLFFFQMSFSQVDFVKGYFIDDENKKTECFIKNLDWRSNPNEFEYKINENSEQLKRDLSNTKEFGSEDLFKFKKFTVKIDKITDDFNKLSFSKVPIYVNETLFLKSVVEGQTSLYEYNSPEYNVCFFSEDKNGNIEQLIFKKYLVDDTNAANFELYKQQLKLLFENTNVTDNDIQKTKYTSKDLTKLFLKSNNISVSNNPKKNKANNLFNIYLRPGLCFSNLSLSNSEIGSSSDFNPATSIRLGIELEYILPINNNKWSILFEPTYNAFETETEFLYINSPPITRPTTFRLDYKTIQLPLGFRYYMFLNKKSKLFLNSAVVFDINSSSTLKSDLGGYDLEIESNISLSGGLGYNYNNLFSIEAKYESRKIINYVYWDSNFNNFSIILGYNFLKRNKVK